MSLKLDLGSAVPVQLSAEGDLARFLRPGIEGLLKLAPAIETLEAKRIQDVPSGSATASFHFDFSAAWSIPQAATITVSVKPATQCTLRVLRPGDELFRYSKGKDAPETTEVVPAGPHYLAITLVCSLGVEGGAQWSSGNVGVSGNTSVDDQFHITNYCPVDGQMLLPDAIARAFSAFALPFHAQTVAALPDGHILDFDFAGNLELGFGATYGISEALIGGRSRHEVTESLSSHVAKAVFTAAPSVQAGAGFKFKYHHNDAFRVVARRRLADGTNSLSLYLLRTDRTAYSTAETFGITLSAGAKFTVDSTRLKDEVTAACPLLATPLNASINELAGDITSSVNNLLEKGDDHKLALEFEQSWQHENTALFLYSFDFAQEGQEAYAQAMQGNYAKALELRGVTLDPCSLVEQIYLEHAGIKLELFDLLGFQTVDEYLSQRDITYLGDRTFQVRDKRGIHSVRSLFKKEQQADIYFLAQCRQNGAAVSGVEVKLRAVLLDKNDAGAFANTERMVAALTGNSEALHTYLASHSPNATVRVTFEADASLFASLPYDAYLNGHPAPEPHERDARNYEQFAHAVAAVLENDQQPLSVFRDSFAKYPQWLSFNQVKNGAEGTTGPGDRKHDGMAGANLWPAGRPPEDAELRPLVQTYIYAAQHFMNLCESLHELAGATPLTTTEAQYDALLDAIRGMLREGIPYPTYFLKPALVALRDLLGAEAQLVGTPATSPGGGEFQLSLEAVNSLHA